MTGTERTRLKSLVDAARRVALGRVCAHCAEPFEPSRFQAHSQMYCGQSCRKAAWYRTEKGKAWRLAKDRARRVAA